jgi:hypothetical protein
LKTVILIVLMILSFAGHSDELVFAELASQNQLQMSLEAGRFSGPGWDFLHERVSQAQHVLAGEDHFTNEIAQLISAISDIGKYANFYIELDPFSTRIIERSIREMSPADLATFRASYGDLFTFYALQPEFALLEKMVSGGAHLLGAEQVMLIAEPLLLQEWLVRSNNEQAKEIYQDIIGKSQQHLAAFLEDQQQPFYFLTPEFSARLETLAGLELSAEERSLVQAMQRSVTIYQTQSHRMRVQLLKHYLMSDYPVWIKQRNLFKFGANHLMRGESFLTVQDIGALIANLAEAQYQESFHVMIIGESGFQGSPFRGLAPTAIDPDDFYLKPLQPFFQLTGDDHWSVFDLVPLRRAYERGELKVENQNLVRTLKGYDALVLIPTVTAAKFPEK